MTTTDDTRPLGERLVGFLDRLRNDCHTPAYQAEAAEKLLEELETVTTSPDGKTILRPVVAPLRASEGVHERVVCLSQSEPFEGDSHAVLQIHANLSPPQPPAWVQDVAAEVAAGRTVLPIQAVYISWGGAGTCYTSPEDSFDHAEPWNEHCCGDQPEQQDAEYDKWHPLQPVRDLAETLRQEQQTEGAK